MHFNGCEDSTFFLNQGYPFLKIADWVPAVKIN